VLFFFSDRLKMKVAWVIIFFSILIWSGVYPKDYLTWVLEVSPAVIGVIVLAATYRSFPLTPLLYMLILIHCIVLMVGGHYTYAEVPLFESLKPLLGFERNNFDKLGHFLQGFVPALIAREILIRKEVIASTNWRNFFIVCFCLAFSALYELIEWVVAIVSATAADAFLGTQGYVWDTQSDMAFALVGAIAALVLLSRVHDRQIRNITSQGKGPAAPTAV
jgi:putative membrane protein